MHEVAPNPPNEVERLAALSRLEVLDTDPEASFDHIARVVRASLNTPISLLSLIDRDRQWFKAAIGMEERQTPRSWAFCAHAILDPENVLVVPDARLDPRFEDNPLVTGESGIRFYAGAPVFSQDGFALGTVCAIDRKPRTGWTEEQEELLRSLAAFASDELELRRRRLEDHAAKLDQIRLLHGDYALSKRRLEDFAETTADWFWEQDENLRFTFFSWANRDGLGPDERSWLGKTRSETGILDISPEARDEHDQRVANRLPYSDFRFSRVSRSGAKRFLSVSGKPIFGPDGEFKGYRGTGRNITRLAEAEKRIAEALRKEEIANRAKADFLANMSHEFRTPLNAIIGFSQIMATEALGPLDNKSYRNFIQSIHRNGLALQDLVERLFELSVIEADEGRFETRTVDVGQIVEASVQASRKTAEEHGISLILEFDKPSPSVKSDSQALEAILTNLLSNAIKFTPAGGTVVVAGRVDETMGQIIGISDQGEGISDEVLARVRSGRTAVVDALTKDSRSGAGIGLLLVMRLVEAIQARIDFIRPERGGTTIELALPIETPGEGGA